MALWKSLFDVSFAFAAAAAAWHLDVARRHISLSFGLDDLASSLLVVASACALFPLASFSRTRLAARSSEREGALSFVEVYAAAFC